MSGAARGELQGTIEQQAARLAGLLAEAGVASVEVRDAQGSRTVRARETDLPGIVASMAGGGGGTLRLDGVAGIVFEIGAQGVRWSATDERALMRLGLPADGETTHE